jgi:glycosyltransferase involved in cell wall biosynthesis
MEYDVVLATRNRQTILRISLPLMLSQTRLPRKYIVVDASEDHREVCVIIERLFRESGTTVELQIFQSKPGSSLQRNIGLRYVESPVVIFPDDDVLWFPDTANNIMRIYERDLENRIGCVASTVSPIYPEGSFGAGAPPYRMESRDRVSARVRTFVGSIEETLVPDPVNPGDKWMSVWGHRIGPSWLAEENAKLCGPVFGYRMSFRTSVIRGIGGFDENLGRYAMFEDSDATIGALCQSLNVVAAHALVYHYRAPEKRVGGWEFGMMAVLNRAYVTCKHSLPRSAARQLLRRYLYYKILRYVAQIYSRYGRRRLKGALYGMSRLKELIDAPLGELSYRYRCAREDVEKESGIRSKNHRKCS